MVLGNVGIFVRLLTPVRPVPGTPFWDGKLMDMVTATKSQQGHCCDHGKAIMATTLKAAPITTISKFRALVLVMAVLNGWTHVQAHTMVDQYTKGDDTIALSWGAGSLKGFSRNGTLVEGGSLMLQRMQHQAFKVAQKGKSLNDLNWKWSKLTAKQVKGLEDLARASFKILPS